MIVWGAAFARTFASDRVFAVRFRLLVDMPKLLSSGAAQQRAATTQTPRRPKGAGGGEERAGQARATMHAPFERQVDFTPVSGTTVEAADPPGKSVVTSTRDRADQSRERAILSIKIDWVLDQARPGPL